MSKKMFVVLVSIIVLVIALSACGSQATKAAPTTEVQPTPTQPVDSLVGDWTGTMYPPEGSDPLGQLDISIQAGCKVDSICGSYSIPMLPCGGTLTYKGKTGDVFQFEQQLTLGEVAVCGTGSMNSITLLEDGTLSQTWTDGVNRTRTVINRK
jgi:hypothetical protein